MVKKIAKDREEGYPSLTGEPLIIKTFLICLLTAFIILMLLARSYDYLPFDLAITLFIQQIQALWFRTLMIVVSQLGTLDIASLTVFIATTYLFVKNRIKECFMLVFSVVGVTMLSKLLKLYVGQPRPSGLLVHQIGTFQPNESFPSGHVLLFIGFYGFLIYLVAKYIRGKVLRIILMTIFSLLIILVSISRIYLGAHWFSDVLGSYLIGLVWLFVIIFIYHRIKL